MKVWSVKKPNRELSLDIAERLGIPPFLAMLLIIRGVTDDDKIMEFLSDNCSFSNPFLMKGMDKAVKRIIRAVEESEKICVYGDYDADGVTSTTLLYSYLNDSLGADAIFYIPSRDSEGYGMNCSAVDYLHKQGVKLIVTVDNGISASREIEYANSLGIDTVVTDHHVPSGEIPNAFAVVDVNQPGDACPFRDFSGVGVAFKLVMAIEGDYADYDSLLENFSDIAAMGTIGDIVPLIGENRALVKSGIRHIQNSDRIGVNAMKEEAGLLDKTITAGNISFALVPRINAGGRLGLSDKSVNLLMTEDVDEANTIAAELGRNNADRQNIEKDILRSIDTMIRENPALIADKILVISGRGWHHGVIGIVASRIKDIYDKPVIIIGIDDDGTARGSGRSIEGFSLCDAVFACSEHLNHFGGHPMAVGLSLDCDNVDIFRKAINDYCRDKTMPYNTLNIDCKLNPAQLNLSLVEQIKLLEPFGCGNPTPVFGLYNMTVAGLKPVGNNRHMRVMLRRGDTLITALYFGLAPEDCCYKPGDTVDLAVTLDVNEYRGQENLSIIIKDIKYSQSHNGELIDNLRIFEKFASKQRLTPDEASQILPDREDFALVYRFLKKNKGFSKGEYALINALGYKIKTGKLRIVLHSMKELGLIQWTSGIYNYNIKLKNSGKVNIQDSIFIKRLREVELNGN